MAEEWAGIMQRDRKFTVSVTSRGDCDRVLSIAVASEELEREEELVLAELRRDLAVPGFRKGKVPVKYIERNYHDAIHNDAVRNLLPEVYEQALARTGIAPIGEPRFDNVQAKHGEEVTFEVAVEVRPEIEVKGYRDLEITARRLPIDDARVDHALGHLRERMAVFKVVDREARPGDVVVIDYAPLLPSGQPDAARTVRNHPADLGGDSLLKEFREGLAGMTMREEKDIHVRYPADFPEEELAGTEKTFRVSVKEIKERELPEVNDEFARRLGERFGDLPGLKARIREDLERDEAGRFTHEVEERIIDRLIELNRFDVPRTMVNNYLESVLEEDRRRRPRVPDEGAREREVRAHFEEAAVRTIRKFLILEAVRRQEGIEVTDAEIEAKVEELSKGAGDEAQRIRDYFSHPERRRSLRGELADEKVLAFLREAAHVKSA